MYTVPLTDVVAARTRIAPYVRRTPLLPAPLLRDDLPTGVRLKLENLQVTGSFKARGAFNNLLQATPEQRERGVVTASGGNHGLAIAYAAWRLNMRATVYLPTTASTDRIARVAAWNAEIIQYGHNPNDTLARAAEHGAAEGQLFVHPFDAERTLHGTGTLGLEVLEDLPDLDCVLIACGGGGLLAGMAAAIKQTKPRVRIISVEPTGAPSMKASIDAGKLIELDRVSTIADTLSPRNVAERTLVLAQQYVDDYVLVEDAAMVAGMRWLWTECNQLVEPSGAAVIAALQTGAVDVRGSRCTVALICGGNAAAGAVFDAYAARC